MTLIQRCSFAAVAGAIVGIFACTPVPTSLSLKNQCKRQSDCVPGYGCLNGSCQHWIDMPGIISAETFTGVRTFLVDISVPGDYLVRVDYDSTVAGAALKVNLGHDRTSKICKDESNQQFAPRFFNVSGPYVVEVAADSGLTIKRMAIVPCVGDDNINLCEAGDTNVLNESVKFSLDRTTVSHGEALQGTISYKNNSDSTIRMGSIVITCRPPGGTNLGGPYLDFSPRSEDQVVQPGQTITLAASRAFTFGDPVGQYWAYATYEDATGTWHDSPIANFTVKLAVCVPITCE